MALLGVLQLWRRRLVTLSVAVASSLVLVSCGTSSLSPSSPSSTAQSPSGLSASTLGTSSLGLDRSATLQYLSMLNAGNGYGFFVQDRTGTCSAIVAITRDGGSMFVRRGTASTWSCAAGTPFSSMAFDAHGNGFLYGPELTITHNGGSTWVRSPASGIVAAVIATSRLLWMVTIECASSHVTSNGCPLLLRYSKDGGRSWLADTALPSSVRIGYPSLRALSLRMGLGGRLELMTAPQTGATNGVALLWQSNRSGKGWLRHEVPCGFTPSAVALAIGPAGELLAGCGSQPGAGQQLKSILVSTNDGMTWRSASHCRLSPAPSRSCLDSPLSDGYLGEVAAPTSSRFFLVGSRSPLLVSTDGGKSWAPSPSVAANSSGGTVQVRFVNPEVGFVIGSDVRLGEDPVIWRTHNGGDSWNVVVPRLF